MDYDGIQEAYEEIKMNETLKRFIVDACHREQEGPPKRNFPNRVLILSAFFFAIIIFIIALFLAKHNQKPIRSLSPSMTAAPSAASSG